MGVKATVFGSRAEGSYFHKLNARWGDKYKLYHNLPYTNVFDLHEGLNRCAISGKTLTLSHSQWQYLLKTSIDYVLCDVDDKPIMCLEYDGLQEGFGAGTQYFPNQTSADTNRSWKMKFKLDVANTFDFLYLVLASRHLEDIEQGSKISIADAIVGEWLVYQELMKEANYFFAPKKIGLTRSEYEKLTPKEQDECKVRWTNKWLTWEKVSAKLAELSPLQQMLKQEFSKIGTLDGMAISCFVYYNDERKKQPFCVGHPMFDNRNFGDAILYGERHRVHHRGHEAEAEAWIPVIKLPNFWGFEVVLRDLVSFLALHRLNKSFE